MKVFSSLRLLALHLFQEMGSSFLFFLQTLKAWNGSSSQSQAILHQIALISTRSAPLVLFSGLFVGAILVLQLQLILTKYDALSFLGGLNTSTLVREVGPLLISFLLAGKIGSYITAELGSMRVTEQMDALECFGRNPLPFLIVPRLIGVLLSSMLLLVLGLCMGVVGSMLTASLTSGINPFQFAGSIPKFISWEALLGSFFKCALYGSIIGTVSCQKGFHARRSAQGVGEAVTEGAAYTHFYILLGSFFSSYFLDWVGRFYQFSQGRIP